MLEAAVRKGGCSSQVIDGTSNCIFLWRASADTTAVQTNAIVAVFVPEYADELPQLGRVISVASDFIELEWLTGCYSGKFWDSYMNINPFLPVYRLALLNSVQHIKFTSRQQDVMTHSLSQHLPVRMLAIPSSSAGLSKGGGLSFTR